MNNQKVPKIRFKGFSGDWEQRKFSDIYEKNNERNNGQFGWNRTISTSTMTFNEIGNGAADSSIDNYKILRVGDIAFEGHTNKEFRYGRFVLNDIGDGIMSPRFATLRPIIKQDLSFWKPYIHDERVMRKKLVRSTKAGTMMNELVIDDLMEQLILVPSLQEQKKIGAFFEGLDNLITLHQSKLDKLKTIKKSMLENCFPKNGEKVPKIRFSGFTDDWEQRKVGELTNVLSASRVHKEEWAEDGVPFFRSSDVVSAFKGTDNEKAFISFDLYEQLAKSSGKLEQNDILITGGGSIGIPYIVPDNKPLYSKDADLIWIKHSDKFDSRYLYTYFTSEGFRRYLSSISHTGTIAHYTIEQVKDTPVELSSIDEQKTLGEFFDNLNSLITLHQSKLDKLKVIKKTLLESMFV